MVYKILADLMVLFHFLWILFLFFGVFWGIRYKAVRLFHLFGLGFAFFIQLFDKYCPLTHLEVFFRAKQNPATNYSGSFIIYYMEKIIYLQIPQALILILTILLCGFNLFIYLGCWRKRGGTGDNKK
ncbi:MAG: DUF2784 domain-containing protein [Deltaproteobacteria bacterium]|nr:DUF2784 domain-containing protein [Deltaproteobacteria bacterium]